MMSGAGTYFSFGRIPLRVSDEALCDRLRLLVPHLHQALTQVAISAAHPIVGRSTFTEIELQLLHCLAAGRSNGEIARLRGRSASTVRNQVHSLLKKLGAANRAEAVRLGLLSSLNVRGRVCRD